MVVRVEWQSTVRDMFSGQMETLRGAWGEQGHPAGEMAQYWPQGNLPGSGRVFHPRDHHSIS